MPNSTTRAPSVAPLVAALVYYGLCTFEFGIGPAATLRHHFRTRLTTTPASYRARFNHINT